MTDLVVEVDRVLRHHSPRLKVKLLLRALLAEPVPTKSYQITCFALKMAKIGMM